MASIVSFFSIPLLGWYGASKHTVKGMGEGSNLILKAMGLAAG